MTGGSCSRRKPRPGSGSKTAPRSSSTGSLEMHSVENLGDAAIHNLIVELKDGAAKQ